MKAAKAIAIISNISSESIKKTPSPFFYIFHQSESGGGKCTKEVVFHFHQDKIDFIKKVSTWTTSG
jgi:hypothetical protein